MKLSNVLICSAAAFCVLSLAVQEAQAVSGRCDNCHTMHNSQRASGSNTMTGGPYANLLTNGGCLGCHKGDSAGEISFNSDSTSAPLVSHSVDPDTNYGAASNATLAGGSFYWVEAGTDATGHNVYETGTWPDPDTIGTLVAPTYAPGDEVTQTYAWSTTKSFSCRSLDDESEIGCHANGAHHKNVNPINATLDNDARVTATSVGDSFRFLDSDGPNNTSGWIYGYEDGDYERSNSSTDHNEYAGDKTGTSTDTMTALCKRCHGDFHGTTNTQASGEWIRHPTDIAVPESGEYANYDTYVPGVPVAFARANITSTVGPNISNINTSGGGTEGLVTCLSCHRAHGSPYDDLLRWDYSTMEAHTAGSSALTGLAKGCFTCHDEKDETF